MIELLAPAGSYESLCAAVNAGADAVYIGGSMFGARAYAENPDEELLIKGIEYCHLHGRKIYMTVNTLLKESELTEKLYSFLLPYYLHGVDGVIVQDLGVVQFVHEYFPGLEVHASTQMTVTSASGAALLKEQGITRVVPARELSLAEIRTIIEETGIEVETFVHGAMCYCYSGQCLMSSMIGGRSGNRGRCAQPCRLPYQLDGDRKNGAVSYLLSMKDMCTLDLIPDLMDAKIASFKIEGRMKRPEYTAGVVSIYRKYIDLYLQRGRNGYRVSEEDRGILMDLYNRGGFSEGYYQRHNGREMMAMERPNHQGTQAARVISGAKGKVRAKALENLGRNDVLEFATGAEYTLGMEIKKGTEFALACPGKIPAAGSIVFRTRNDSLLDELNRKYILENTKEKIKGDLRILNGSPAILKLTWKNIAVTVCGVCAQTALTNPVTEESIRKQMMKTGNTPYEFEEIEIRMDDDLFVPVRDLNNLRREGLSKLESAVLEQFVRKLPDHTDEEASELADSYRSKKSSQMSEIKNTNVLVTTWEQLSCVCASKGTDWGIIYFDSMLFSGLPDRMEEYSEYENRILRIKERGIRCFFNCPPVFRDRDRHFLMHEKMQRLLAFMDGYLLHTIDQLAWFLKFRAEQNPDAVLAADSGLYAYNRMAASYLTRLGIGQRTLPAELNIRELSGLDHSNAELEIYGYQPLMQSAQCVRKNTKGCLKKTEILYLKDRKKTSFPVLNRCYVCCNTIFNSVPLNLFGSLREIGQMGVETVRISFTIESAAETEAVLSQYRQMYAGQESMAGTSESTRGHFKRGVE